MAFDLANLLACLDLRRTGQDTFQGDNLDLPYRRLFGGQLLAQGIRALHETGGGKEVKSLTQYFTREGDVTSPVDYVVAGVQAGRTFATSIVTAKQPTADGTRTIASLSGSLHAPEPGPERSTGFPDVIGHEDAEPVELRVIPWDFRVIGGVDLADPATRPPAYRFWMRVGELAEHADVDQPWVHQALLAYASEPTIIGTALLPVAGVSQADATVKFSSAVTSHSVWFHAPVRIDDWVLVDQHSPTMSGSRVFGRADVWTQDGRLIASLAQESLVRMTAAG